MQMERVRAGWVGTSGNGDLDDLVRGKCVVASGGNEVLRSLRTAQDLQQSGGSRRDEGLFDNLISFSCIHHGRSLTTPFMVNLPTEKSRSKAKLIDLDIRPLVLVGNTYHITHKSAPPTLGLPGTGVGTRGWRFVSRRGLVLFLNCVLGSHLSALAYRRIAELMPPAKVVLPKFGTLLTQ